MTNSLLLILATIAITALIDYIPRIFVRAKRGVQVQFGRGYVPHYLIMPTVYNDIAYLKNISFLKKYSKHVVICTSKYESEEFYSQLEVVCEQYGFRYIRVALPTVKGVPVKNAYTIYRGVFQNLGLLNVSPQTPCLLIDADTYSLNDINDLAFTFVSSGADMASLRCEVAEPKKLIEVLQAFEYKMAMDNRVMDSWLTSGACNIGKAGMFQHVFSKHSNFFAGGDIEIGKLARVMAYRVRYINFAFYTAVPDTLKSWYKQRIIWFAGGFRHHIANIASFGWHHFFILIYNSLIVYLLFPLRWIEIINFPATMLLLIVLSWIYTYILTFRKGWRKEYLVLPFYGFIQSMVILPVAAWRYFTYVRKQRSFGLLKYDFSHVGITLRSVYALLNISSAVLILYAAALFTISRVDYWAQHGHIIHYLGSLFT